MPLHVLDTDTCVFALRHRPVVLRRLQRHSPDDVAVTTVTEAELYFGALRSRDPAASRASVDAFLAPLARLSFDSAAADHHARIRDSLVRRPMGERDLIIASIVRQHGATLVTHNTSEFSRVDGLQIEDWFKKS